MMSTHQELLTHLKGLIAARDIDLVIDDHVASKLAKQYWDNIDLPPEYPSLPKDYRETGFIMSLRIDEFRLQKVDRPEGKTFVWLSAHPCSKCGEHGVHILTGNKLRIDHGEDCRDANELKVEINFMSDEVLIMDRPYEVSKWQDHAHPDHFISLNDYGGMQKESKWWADNNVASFFVGNTCPRVYMTGDGKLVIRPEEDVNLPDANYLPTETFDNPVSINTVCTDLWWVTMVDKVTFFKLASVLPGMTDDAVQAAWNDYVAEDKVVRIPQGKYEFTYKVIFSVDGDSDPATRVTGVKV